MIVNLSIDGFFKSHDKGLDLEQSEQVLVKECIAGNKRAQKVLYESTYKRMLGICMRYTQDNMEAEDMLHDGYIKIFDKLRLFRFQSKLSTWMTRLMINNILDQIRKKKDLIVYTDEALDHERNTGFDEEELNDLSCDQIIELMRKLPLGYRTVLSSYSIDGLSHREISKVLGISEASSRSQLTRARKMFGTIIKEWKKDHE